MKLPKSLLYAILVGVTVATTVSCSNDDDSKPKSREDEEQVAAEPCPACGMG
jgi:hypothetical protein